MGAGKVAIIGAGRLGSLLAQRLPAGCRKVIIARRKEQAQALADEVGGIASDTLAAARGSAAVLLAVPAAVVADVAVALVPHIDGDTLVVNMAPDLLSSDLAARYPHLRVAGAKLVGHAGEMLHGADGAVVIEAADREDARYLTELLGGVGMVLPGRETEVQQGMTILAEEVSGAAESARRRLEEMGLPSALIRVALYSAAPGLLRDAGRPAPREAEPAWPR